MADRAVIYEDVEVLDHDRASLTCRIGNDRVVVRRYVPMHGTVIRQTGDRGRLALPRWYVEQRGLPLERHPTDHEAWSAEAPAVSPLAVPAREARAEVEMVQFATRIPRSLLQRLRVWSINHDTHIMAFVEAAIREALEKARDRRP